MAFGFSDLAAIKAATKGYMSLPNTIINDSNTQTVAYAEQIKVQGGSFSGSSIAEAIETLKTSIGGAVDSVVGGLIFKGGITKTSDVPSTNNVGWTYVATAAIADFHGVALEAGDMVIVTTKNATTAAGFTIVNRNIDSTKFVSINTVGTAVGSATKPVYVSSAGVVTACSNSLNKTVPSNASFTDTASIIDAPNLDSGAKRLTFRTTANGEGGNAVTKQATIGVTKASAISMEVANSDADSLGYNNNASLDIRVGTGIKKTTDASGFGTIAVDHDGLVSTLKGKTWESLIEEDPSMQAFFPIELCEYEDTLCSLIPLTIGDGGIRMSGINKLGHNMYGLMLDMEGIAITQKQGDVFRKQMYAPLFRPTINNDSVLAVDIYGVLSSANISTTISKVNDIALSANFNIGTVSNSSRTVSTKIAQLNVASSYFALNKEQTDGSVILDLSSDFRNIVTSAHSTSQSVQTSLNSLKTTLSSETDTTYSITTAWINDLIAGNNPT